MKCLSFSRSIKPHHQYKVKFRATQNNTRLLSRVLLLMMNERIERLYNDREAQTLRESKTPWVFRE